MLLRSQFRLWALLPFVLFIITTVTIIFLINNITGKSAIPLLAFIIYMIILLFTWTWLVFGEFRTKAIKVEIENKVISVSNYYGLGSRKVYSFSQFNGFETALLPTRYDTYEYLYLVENDRKVVKISEFYHKNYLELKNIIASNCNNLGLKKFRMAQEVREIFT